MEGGVDGSIRPTVESGIKPNHGEFNLRVGSETVRVSCAEFSPPLDTNEERERFDPSKAVIFLPGWPWKADKSVIYGFPRSLALRSGARTLSIDTRASKIGPDSLHLESAGIAMFLKQAGIHGVTIVGHSEGAIRAVDLAVILQDKYPDIKINGVVLANPMGMDNRNLAQLAGGFLWDVFRISGQERSKMGVGSPKGLVMQFVQSLLRDIAFAKVGWPPMLKNQLNNLVRINPYLEQIKAPVVVMATDRDLVSNLRRYLPPSDVENKLPPSQSEEEFNYWLDKRWERIEREQPEILGEMWEKMKEEQQAEYGSKENFFEEYQRKFNKEKYRKDAERRRDMVNLTRARQQYLKENLLPEAESVVFLVGTNAPADHAGIPDSRHEQVAHIINRVFDRLKRPKSI